VRTAALAMAVVAACGPRPAAPRSAPIALTLPALDGGDVELIRLRGEVVVVHAFTTWSVAAQLDVDQLIAADGADDVTVVGVALDEDGRQLVAPWRAAGGVRYLVALADAEVRAGRSALGPLPEVPTTLVLDPEGRITAKVERQLRPGELAKLIGSAKR
jgi:hypothetical protein